MSGIKRHARAGLDVGHEVGLGRLMAAPDLVRRQPHGRHQHLRLVLPARHVLVVELGEGRMRPGAGMDAVGDGVDAITGKHAPRGLGVAPGDAVGVAGQAERQARHVETVLARQLLQFLDLDQIGQQPLHEVVGEPVVPGLDRRMGGEHAMPAHHADVVLVLARAG